MIEDSGWKRRPGLIQFRRRYNSATLDEVTYSLDGVSALVSWINTTLDDG